MPDDKKKKEKPRPRGDELPGVSAIASKVGKDSLSSQKKSADSADSEKAEKKKKDD